MKYSLKAVLHAVLLLIGLTTDVWPRPPQNLPEPTTATVESQIRRLENQPRPDETTTRLLEIYRQIRDQLQLADRWSEQSAVYDEKLKTVPKELDKISAELAKAPEEIKPQPGARATLAQITQSLTQAQTDVTAAQNQVNELSRSYTGLVERHALLPTLLSDAKKRLERIKTEASPTTEANKDETASAKRMLVFASLKAVRKEVEALEKELASSESREKLAQVQRDLETRKVTQLEQLVRAWREILAANRRIAAQETVDQARLLLTEAVAVHPGLQRLGNQVLEAAMQRVSGDNLPAKIEELETAVEQIKQSRTKINESYERVTTRVANVGLTNSIGLFLLQKRAELPSLKQHQEAIETRQELIATAQNQLLAMEEETGVPGSLEAQAQQILNRLDPLPEKSKTEAVVAEIRQLLLLQDRLRKESVTDTTVFFESLVNLDSEEQGLINDIKRYTEFIDENVLWVRSVSPLKQEDFLDSVKIIGSIVKWRAWQAALGALWQGIRREPFINAFYGVAFILLLIGRDSIRKISRKNSQRFAADGIITFAETLTAFFFTVLGAVIWPVTVWLLGWRLSVAGAASEAVTAVATGLGSLVLVLFVTEFTRLLCQPKGLAELHFDWSAMRCTLIRREVFKLHLLFLPAFFLASALGMRNSGGLGEVAGRLPFMFGMVVLAVTAYRVFHPILGLWGTCVETNTWSVWSGWLRCWSVILFLVGIAVAAGMGFTYAAWQVSQKCALTLGLLFVWGVLRVLSRHWMETHSPIPKAVPAEPLSATGDATVPPAVETDPQWEAVNQVYRLVQFVLLLVLAGSLWSIWDDIFPALRSLDRVELWQRVVEVSATVTGPDGIQAKQIIEKTVPTTLADLLLALVIGILTVLTVQNLPALFRFVLLRRLPLDSGARYAAIAITRYLLIVAGLVASLGYLGLTWSKVQWLAAAVTVGLGFGLQEIFANFVSGIIIFFERPMRIGDIVTIGTTTGRVMRIGARATIIRDFDRKELIVPNKSFITGQLVNWTLTDTVNRLILRVGVDFDTDTALVETLMLQAATEQPGVLPDPQPFVVFYNFGEHSLVFQLYVYINDIDLLFPTQHAINNRITQLFHENGIDLAYPQQDIYIQSFPSEATLAEQVTKVRGSNQDERPNRK